MSSIIEKDQYARERIKNDIHTNFFVEAGAGSGKTFSLVERMVSMVENGIDVRKICAITFTKAAAGEFYSRFHKRLIERSKESGISEEAKLNIENAINNIDLCFMGTIDSFCNMIIGEHPNFAGVPSDAAVKTSEEMKPIYIREYSKILRGEYGEELRTKYRKCAAFNYHTKDLFSSAADRISEIRNSETVLNDCDDSPLDEKYAHAKKTLSKLFSMIEADRGSIFIPTNSKSSPNKYTDMFDELAVKSYLLSESWDKYPTGVTKLLKNFGDMRLSPGCVFAEAFPDWVKAHNTNRGLSWYNINTEPIVSELTEIKYHRTVDFIVSAVTAISDKLCSEGNMKFFDYLYFLRNMLKKDAEGDGRLINHIYGRHSYFLIDEFQDTNPMQSEIFFYLTAEKPVSDWKQCVPRPGSVFIVGDPKQSIYRFRNADVTSYLGVKELFKREVGEVLSLSRNFRSTKPICEWFNRKFSELMPEDTGIQPEFEPIPAEENDPADGCFGGVYRYETPFHRNLDKNADTDNVSSIISTLVDNPKYLIKGNGDKVPRKIEYRDIMVITPKKGVISNFISKFRRLGIPVRAEGTVSFANSDALRCISEIYSAVANPTDEQAVYGALTGMFFGLSKNEIADFVQSGGTINLYAKNNAEKIDRVSETLEILRPMAFSAAEQSPVTVFSRLQTELRIFEKAGTDFLECYYYALELLRDAESRNEISSLKEAALLLRNTAENNTAEERCISLTENENRVHIANLHKVKGLEAPVVILASPYWRDNSPDFRVADTETGRKNWIFSFPADKGNALSTASFTDELELEKQCLGAEKTRLLYVAATRARSALIIGRAVKSDGTLASYNIWDPLIDDNMPNILSFCGIPNEPSDSGKPASAELYMTDAETVFADRFSQEKTYEIKRPSMLAIKAKTSSEEEYEDTDTGSAEKARHREDAALIGTIVHRLMELIVSSGDKLSRENLISEIVSDFGLDDEKYQEILGNVYDIIHNGGYEQNNGMIKDILSELMSADEVYCEVPFCSKEANETTSEIWNGVMDVVYCKNGKWHIVDYKTNADADDLDEKYIAQLNAYVSAFKQMTGKYADALIYHIDV